MGPTKHLQHIRLTSHPEKNTPVPFPLKWGAADPLQRGPVIAAVTQPEFRNCIGTHSGSYSVYRALAIAAGSLKAEHKPDFTNTSPTDVVGPYPSWAGTNQIVSLDPFGHLIESAFTPLLATGIDIRPSIAITKAHVYLPEIHMGIKENKIQFDGKILTDSGAATVTKAALEPVWYLPGISARFGCEEGELRRILFENTAGMYPELITRPDLQVFLPPIGGITVYIFGDPQTIHDPKYPLTVRVHDECNGSDVFGSDICTCRPYLIHGIELCIESAQQGGAGVIVYNRKEGRALGEVTKFLVYNARKRQEGGDTASKYFARTECVAGVQDVRFQELMPDVLHWLGIQKIDRLVSMSNMKYDAIVKSGIGVKERVALPADRVPDDAQVEIEAKKTAGYFSDTTPLETAELGQIKGRTFT
jgi:GTP cyclohydrolase II